MAGKQIAIILDAGTTLDDRQAQITDLSGGGADDAVQNSRPDSHFQAEAVVHHQRIDDTGDDGKNQTANGSFDGLFGAHIGRQLVLSKSHAGEQRKAIAHPDGDPWHEHQQCSAFAVADPHKRRKAQGQYDGSQKAFAQHIILDRFVIENGTGENRHHIQRTNRQKGPHGRVGTTEGQRHGKGRSTGKIQKGMLGTGFGSV